MPFNTSNTSHCTTVSEVTVTTLHRLQVRSSNIFPYCKCVKSFWCALHQAVLNNRKFSVSTNKLIYTAYLYGLFILLYGAECWTPLQSHLKQLDSFHNHCMRSVMGITSRWQQTEHTASRDFHSNKWEDDETVSIKLTKPRIGHVARMFDNRILHLGGFHSTFLLDDRGML